MNTLDQWEEESAIINPNTGESTAMEVHLATRILTLIRLIRKKDEALKDLFIVEEHGIIYQKRFQEARAAYKLTEDLK